MRNIKLVIFDLDGTLVDAYKAITESFNYAMQKLNYPRQDDLVIRHAVGWGDENLLKPFVIPQDLKKALALYRRHHQISLVRYSRLLPGAGLALGYLKNKGYNLAIASNRPTKFSLILIHHLAIDKYLDFLLCADKLKRGKPDPEILNLIMRKFSISRASTLYIGDMAIDAQTGKAAGVKTVIVTGGSSTLQEIKKERPYRIIKRITELRNML